MPYLLLGVPLLITNIWRSGLFLMFACGLCIAVPVQAKSHSAANSRHDVRMAEVDSAGAARLVERQTGGKVLSVQRQDKKGRSRYRVKVLLPEGRVRTINVDAETGQMDG